MVYLFFLFVAFVLIAVLRGFFNPNEIIDLKKHHVENSNHKKNAPVDRQITMDSSRLKKYQSLLSDEGKNVANNMLRKHYSNTMKIRNTDMKVTVLDPKAGTVRVKANSLPMKIRS